jgi:anti-sigma regulatory factor (Ser/Thr protein kinase)
MKYLRTNLEGKIRNLPSFKSEALLPLFEAIVNAIQAIDERGNGTTGEITIRVAREPKGLFDDVPDLPIRDFVITDNGIGFNDINFDSFETSDSGHKEALGGKGIGRFLWLKAFDHVEVDSVYKGETELTSRKFLFTTKGGIHQMEPNNSTLTQTTTVTLAGLKEEYRKLPTAYKTTAKISQRILEHCLSYFISGDAPKIVLIDENETVNLNELFKKEILPNLKEETIELSSYRFDLTHIKLYATHEKMHNAVLCANRRDVKAISLAKALGTGSQFDEESQKFTYALYVASPYLDKYVDSYRLDFSLPKSVSLFPDEEIVTEGQLEEAIANSARQFLSTYLSVARERKQDLIASYVSNENPGLRSVPNYCPEVFDEIEPSSTPEKINEVLYKYKGKAEFEVRKKSDQLLKTQAKSIKEIEQSFVDLTSQITDIQKDNLVNYLCDRRRMISLLEKKLELNADGKYSNEDIIHDLIFPRKSTTDEISFESHNLWVIDETLAFHAFAASDKPLNQTTASASSERPDIVAFAEVDEDKVARAVSIIEFKKPQRKSYDEDPTKQLYRYLREIKENKKVRLPNGRDLHVADTTRYYCFAICDITQAIHEFAENNGGYALLKGELGYYMYNRGLNAHTEILHFDKIVVDAKRRHKAFFEKLGIS